MRMRRPWILKDWLLLGWFVGFVMYHMTAGILALNLPQVTHYYPQLVTYPGYIIDFATVLTRPGLLLSIFLESLSTFLTPLNILLSAAVVLGISLATKHRSIPKFKTGDQHPLHKSMAFVEYDEHARRVWTSVYEDIEVPYRLARVSEQRRTAGKHSAGDNQSEDSRARRPDTSETQHRSAHDARQNKNQAR